MTTFDSYYDYLLEKCSDIVIDTNLLLLYIVGSHDISLIKNRSISRVSMFVPGEFFVLKYIIDSVKSIKISTNIWTEICNFADKRPKNNKIEDYYDTLVKMIKNYKEEYFSCFDICNKGYLKDFDLTDSTIIELAKDGCLVVTADRDLAEFLSSKELDVINWNKIKDKILSKYKQ